MQRNARNLWTKKGRHKTAKIHMEASLHQDDIPETCTNWRERWGIQGLWHVCRHHLPLLSPCSFHKRKDRWSLKQCHQDHGVAEGIWTAQWLKPAGTQLRKERSLPMWQDLEARQMRLLPACSVTVRRVWLQIQATYFESSLALLSLFSLRWKAKRSQEFQFHREGCGK